MTNDDTQDQLRPTAFETVPEHGDGITVEHFASPTPERPQGDNLMALVLALADASIRLSSRR